MNVLSSAGNRVSLGLGRPFFSSGRLRASSFRDSLIEKRRLCTSPNSVGADLAPEEKALAMLWAIFARLMQLPIERGDGRDILSALSYSSILLIFNRLAVSG